MLSIDGQSYAVSPLARAPGGSRSFRLAKVGGDEAVYDLDGHGDRVECGCPGYRKTHEGTSSLCKHGRALVMVGLLEAPGFAAAAGPGPGPGPEPEAAAVAVVAPFDREPYRAQNAVVEGRAEWLSSRPAGADRMAHEGLSDLSDDGWDDAATWGIGPAGDTLDARTWDASLDAEDDDAPDREGDDAARWTTTDLEPTAADFEPAAPPLADGLADRIALLRAEGSPLGDLMADHLEGLAGEIAATDATTVEQFRDRRAALACSG